MKKSILIVSTVIACFSLMAFGYINWGNTSTDQDKTSCKKAVDVDNALVNTMNNNAEVEFFYDVNSMFINTITKESLHNANSVIDIYPKRATKWVESYQTVKVGVYHSDEETIEMGEGDVLNEAQKGLLQSTDYSSNFSLSTNAKSKNADTGAIEDVHIIFYMTVIPEKEAVYKGGDNALMEYLRENSKEDITTIEKDQLKPGKVSFVVSKNGTVTNPNLIATCGYTSIDNAMSELITTLPDTWDPATNSKGENVEQEFFFFFGLIGC